MNGHINNGAIGAFCEAGRAEIMHAVAGPPEARAVGMAVARVEIDYLREIHYPGRVADRHLRAAHRPQQHHGGAGAVPGRHLLRHRARSW